ncbi:MAG: hypothetical protein EBS56_07300 [Planctomycetia bacterium]|nr:hypothetical protein [Planctomycetia bacterium]
MAGGVRRRPLLESRSHRPAAADDLHHGGSRRTAMVCRRHGGDGWRMAAGFLPGPQRRPVRGSDGRACRLGSVLPGRDRHRTVSLVDRAPGDDRPRRRGAAPPAGRNASNRRRAPRLLVSGMDRRLHLLRHETAGLCLAGIPGAGAVHGGVLRRLGPRRDAVWCRPARTRARPGSPAKHTRDAGRLGRARRGRGGDRGRTPDRRRHRVPRRRVARGAGTRADRRGRGRVAARRRRPAPPGDRRAGDRVVPARDPVGGGGRRPLQPRAGRARERRGTRRYRPGPMGVLLERPAEHRVLRRDDGRQARHSRRRHPPSHRPSPGEARDRQPPRTPGARGVSGRLHRARPDPHVRGSPLPRRRSAAGHGRPRALALTSTNPLPSTRREDPMPLRHPHLIVLVATVATLAVGFWPTPFWDEDEPRFAAIARTMLDTGDWVVPTYNGTLAVDKPVLMHWCMAACFAACGESEIAARLPSALATVLTALALLRAGTRWFGPLAGVLAALSYVGCLLVAVESHAATPDAILTALTTWATILIAEAWLPAAAPATGDRRLDPGRALLPGGLMGLAVLCKGPIGFVGPLAVALPWVWGLELAGRLRRGGIEPHTLGGLLWSGWLAVWSALRSVRIVTLTLSMLAVAAPWYVAVGLRTGGAWPAGFFLVHNVGRFAAPMEKHGGSVLYHPLGLLVGFYPWSCFLPLALVLAGWRLWKRIDPPRSAAVTLVLLWLVVWVGGFSAAATKLPNYIMPAYPAAALVVAAFAASRY